MEIESENPDDEFETFSNDFHDDDDYDDDEAMDGRNEVQDDINDDDFSVDKNGWKLRRQRWGRQKRRRKHRRKFFGKTVRGWCRFFTEWIIFYTTFFFVLLVRPSVRLMPIRTGPFRLLCESVTDSCISEEK